MILRILKRIQRSPVPALAVLLFTSILSLVLCGLDAASKQELEDYQHIYRTTPVTFTITNLTGTQIEYLKLPAWATDVFIGDALLPHSLKEYVEDVQIQAEYQLNPELDTIHIDGTLQNWNSLKFSGITAEELVEGGTTWNASYGTDLFLSTQSVCILPQIFAVNGQVPQTVSLKLVFVDHKFNGQKVTHEYQIDLTVAGTHQGEIDTVYCPYALVRDFYRKLEQPLEVDSITATLADNDLLEQAREEARYWFPEPDLSGAKIPWDFGAYTYYPYALRIDDSQLRALEETLENSLTINRICTTLVFVLSAGAGFFVGFLMIRSRKWETALMRTMGTPNGSIYASLVLEQMLCVLLGTLLGGSYFLFQPVARLAAFIGIYFAGLSIALLIFLNSNLLTSIKEDE